MCMSISINISKKELIVDKENRNYAPKYKNNVWKFQVVVNLLGQVSHISGPFFGRCSDTTIFRATNPYVPRGMYILGDKAYVSNPRVLPPIKESDRHVSAANRLLFNCRMGHYRSRVEHAIRWLKTWGITAGRWRCRKVHRLGHAVRVIASLRSIMTSIEVPYAPDC